MISIHKAVLQRVRDEHDNILGSNLTEKTSQLEKNSFLLNQFPYTLAVIKETMRLFLVVASTRAGVFGFEVVDAHGRSSPPMVFWSGQILRPCIEIRSGGLNTTHFYLRDGWLRPEILYTLISKVRGGQLSTANGIALGRKTP